MEHLCELSNEIMRIEMLMIIDLHRILKHLQQLVKDQSFNGKTDYVKINTLMSITQNIDVIEQRISHILAFHGHILKTKKQSNCLSFKHRLKLELCSYQLSKVFDVYGQSFVELSAFIANNSELFHVENPFENEQQIKKVLEWCQTIGYPDLLECITEEKSFQSTTLLHCHKFYTMHSERQAHQEFISKKSGVTSKIPINQLNDMEVELF